MATQTLPQPPSGTPRLGDPERRPSVWIFSVGLLAAMYSLLFLSTHAHFSSMELMQRCVLMDPKLSRIWSVANVEVGVAYFGVFGAMTYYFVKIRHAQSAHITDLGLALLYLAGSFLLDWFCVKLLSPFPALLVGDAIVMTFTLLVSREIWFQRLLGVFVPIIFLTCGLGHLLEGMSYWHLTYTTNVPWSMVTADIGFAVLVNSARFPSFIRGADVQKEFEQNKELARQQYAFCRDVLFSVTDGKLCLHESPTSLLPTLPERARVVELSRDNLSEARAAAGRVADEIGMPPKRKDLMITAAGEALMNAIVHGTHSEMTVCAADGRLQVWVKDDGKGISLENMPMATLQKGWSTQGTMGIGFPLILSTADTVDLATSPSGTIVVITVNSEPPIPVAVFI